MMANAPFWSPAPALPGPASPGYTRLSKKASRDALSLVLPPESCYLTSPIRLQACYPPHKELRNVLATMVDKSPTASAYDDDIYARWPATDGVHFVDITQPFGVGASYGRDGTQAFLSGIHRWARERIQELRLRSFKNGRYWPAPQRLEFGYAPGATTFTRMQFVDGYNPPNRPWIQYGEPHNADWPLGRDELILRSML